MAKRSDECERRAPLSSPQRETCEWADPDSRQRASAVGEEQVQKGKVQRGEGTMGNISIDGKGYGDAYACIPKSHPHSISLSKSKKGCSWGVRVRVFLQECIMWTRLKFWESHPDNSPLYRDWYEQDATSEFFPQDKTYTLGLSI